MEKSCWHQQRDLISKLLLMLSLFTTLSCSTQTHRRGHHDETYSWRVDWHSVDKSRNTKSTPLPGHILNSTTTNVTVQLSGTAYLHCSVPNIGNRVEVSWIRKRDWHILSSGMFIYTNDERFQILHGEDGDDWTLQIKYVQKRDNGTYECQVASGSGLQSHFVFLNIVVPEAFILGSDEHHVDLGSVINLICIIEKSPTPPQFVFWYHNDRMINYDNSRGITVDTEPGPRTQSRLTIREAQLTDSGNYTCNPSNTEPASIHVFVSEGSNKMAAIRRNANSVSDVTSNALCCLMFASVLFCYTWR